MNLHNHYERKWPCTINSLYNENTLIGRLHKYFSAYFETFSAPSAETLFLLVLSILALESAHSIRFLYRHFLSGITKKSLNAFYYACSYAKVDCSGFMNVTAKTALHLIPESLKSQPVFICIDDTMVSKFRSLDRVFIRHLRKKQNVVSLQQSKTVIAVLIQPRWGEKIS